MLLPSLVVTLAYSHAFIKLTGDIELLLFPFLGIAFLMQLVIDHSDATSLQMTYISPVNDMPNHIPSCQSSSNQCFTQSTTNQMATLEEISDTDKIVYRKVTTQVC